MERAASPHRINQPIIRTRFEQDAKSESCSWEQALVKVTERLERVLQKEGPEAVLHIEYAGNIGLLTWYLPQRLWYALGATATDYTICSASGHKALGLHYGASHGIQPEILQSQQLIVFWGFNALVSSPHMWNLAVKARNNQRAKIVVIDPRQSKSAKQADLWLTPRPSSDVALALGLCNFLIQQNYLDLTFIEQWTQGFDHLKGFVKSWTGTRVEKETGIPQNLFEEFGTLYGTTDTSVIMIGIGVQKTQHGADVVRAISYLPALKGIHRGFFFSNGTAYPVDYRFLTGESLTTQPPNVVSQVGLGEFIKEGKFKFIYIYNCNPALTLPNQRAFRKGLRRDDVFVVVHDTHHTETTALANVILPAPTFLEKTDVVVPWSHHYIRLSQQIIKSHHDCRSEIWVKRELAKRLNLDDEWLFEDEWKVLDKVLSPALEDGTFADLLSGKMLKLRSKELTEYPTPSGKIEFYATKAAEEDFDPIPQYKPLPLESDQFVLLNSALSHYTHTQFQDIYGEIPSIVQMNPQDAAANQQEEGHKIVLYNEMGEVEYTLNLTIALPRGVLWAPRQGKGINREPQNLLTSKTLQQIGRGPTFNSTIVRIKNPSS
jgi:anaerobic selenocysteine-containing dehydrogenase